MNLFRIGRIWWIDYRVNKKRYRRSTGTANKKLAEAFVANIQTARKAPTFEAAVEILKILYQKPVEGLLPVSAIWKIYSDLARSIGKDQIDPNGWTRRKNVVDRFSKWLAEKFPIVKTIENINGQIAAAYAKQLTDDGLKTKTRKNLIGELVAVWKLLEKASRGITNPWRDLMPRDTDGQRGKAFTPDHEKRVLEAAQRVGKDWYPLSVLMRQTGLRYGDVARLTWAEIVDGVIRTDPHKTKRHGISVAIPLTAEAQSAIGSLERRGDFLFPLHSELYGNRGRQAREILNFREVLTAAGLADAGYTVHSWRHTAATRLAASGADIETRKRILGHTVDETARRYDHDEHLAETLKALEAAT